MKALPLPLDTPLWVQAIFWLLLICIGVLAALSVWFLKRYIEKNDKHHEGVDAKLSKMEESNKTRDAHMTTLTTQIKEEALKIERSAADMKKSQAEFTIQVNKELLEINKATHQIKTDLTDGNSKVGLLKKDLEGLIKTVDGHQRSLSLGAQVMAKQREELGKMQTEIVRINDDLIIIKEKKPKN